MKGGEGLYLGWPVMAMMILGDTDVTPGLAEVERRTVFWLDSPVPSTEHCVRRRTQPETAKTEDQRQGAVSQYSAEGFLKVCVFICFCSSACSAK